MFQMNTYRPNVRQSLTLSSGGGDQAIESVRAWRSAMFVLVPVSVAATLRHVAYCCHRRYLVRLISSNIRMMVVAFVAAVWCGLR